MTQLIYLPTGSLTILSALVQERSDLLRIQPFLIGILGRSEYEKCFNYLVEKKLLFEDGNLTPIGRSTIYSRSSFSMELFAQQLNKEENANMKQKMMYLINQKMNHDDESRPSFLQRKNRTEVEQVSA